MTYNGCVVELGSVFSACLVLSGGRLVDGRGGTSGPLGWHSGGVWDGEAAYLLSPLSKRDLFTGGAATVADAAGGPQRFIESLAETVAGLRAVTAVDEVVLSGRLLESEPVLTAEIEAHLRRLAPVVRLEPLSGAWVKQAAQGAAIVADGLSGGRYEPLVEHLQLRQATGTVLDGLQYPRAREVRGWFVE
jgi:predicted butyrate kinase (DUF1464 family)